MWRVVNFECLPVQLKNIINVSVITTYFSCYFYFGPTIDS